MAQEIKVIAKMVDKGVVKTSKKITRGLSEMDGRQRKLAQASAMFGKTTGQLSSELQKQGVFIDKTGRGINTMNGRFLNTNKALKKAAGSVKQFKMELLGTLFFGMMLQQVFMGIMQSGTEAFMKITEGQTMAGQAITRLSAAFQFLQYSIGDAIGTALLPHLDAIINIIDAMGDWIEQNPELTAGLLTVGVAVGTFLMAWGMLGLGLTSTAQAFPIISKLAMGLGGALGIAGAGAKVAALGIGLVIAPILLAAAAITFLWFAWQENWFNIRQFAGTVVKGIANVFYYLVKIIEVSTKPIMDSLNAVGATIAYIRGEAYKPINLQFLRGIGQQIFSYGEALTLEGQRFNRARGIGAAEMPTPFGTWGTPNIPILSTGGGLAAAEREYNEKLLAVDQNQLDVLSEIARNTKITTEEIRKGTFEGGAAVLTGTRQAMSLIGGKEGV